MHTVFTPIGSGPAGSRLAAATLTLAGVLAAPVALAAPAAATPSDGISAVTLSTTIEDGREHLLREITIAPGGSTGWHWHDGTLFGVVRQGTLTHNMADCSLDGSYGPGAAITERAGAEHAHIGRNLGTVPVVLQAVYIIPVGGPLAHDAPDPGCGYT